MLVMAGLVPAIHVFPDLSEVRRGCPAQGRAWRKSETFSSCWKSLNAGCFFGQALKELANGSAPTRWLNPRHSMFHLGNRQTAM